MSPGRIALGYGFIAILWIAFSDAVVTHFKLDPAVMTIKGAVFVFVTASLLYFTIRRLVQTLQLTSQERDETAELYRTVVEASNEGICLLDQSGRISFLNGRLAAMLGRPAEELQGKRLHDFIEEPHVLAQQGAQQSETHECRLRTDSDRKPWVLISRHPVLNEAGEVVQLVGTVIDITERKWAEQEVRNTAAQWQATFDAVQDVVLLLDKDGRIVRANHAAAEFLELPCDTIVGGHCYGLIHGTSTPPAECPLAKMRQSRRHEEAEVLAREGGPWLSVSADPVFDPSGELTHVVHVTRDITERKRAEETLRQSEAYLAEAQRLSHTGSWAFDVASNEYVYASEEFLRIFGIAQDTLWTVEATLQRIHPGDRERVKRNLEKIVREKVDTLDEYRIVLPDGTLKHIHVTGHPILNEAGEVVQLVGTVIDITERKRAEEEHRAHVLFLESMDRVNRAMQGSNDLEQVMSHVLEVVLSIFGGDRAWLVYPCDSHAPTWRVAMEHTRPEFPGAFVLGHDLPMDPEVARVFDTARSSGGAVRFGPGVDQPVPEQLAERFSIQSMIAMVVLPKLGQPYLFGLHQCSGPRVWEPTEERLFQEIGRRLTDALTSVLIFRSLRDSERRLEEAQRIAHVGYWDRDLDAGRITLSDEGARIFGLQPEDRVTDLTVWHERWQTLIHPEDRPRAAAAAAAALAGGPRYDVEYRVVHRTGEERIVHSQGDVIRDASGRPCRMFGIMQDITERKRAEAELRTSEERFRTLVQFSFDVYWESDAQHRFTRQEFAEGLADAPAPGSEIGKTRWEVPYLEPDEETWQKHRATLDAHLPFRDFELARPTPDGGKRYVSVSGLPVFDETGHFLGYRGVGRHITDRKRAEQALRQSEAYLAEAQRLSHTGSWAFDVASNKYIYASEECLRIFELDAQEGFPTREAVSRLIHPEDWDSVQESFEKSLREKVDTTTEFRITPPSGTVKYVHVVRHPVLNEAGEVIQLVGTVIDITERKRAEEERRQSAERFRAIADYTYDWENWIGVDGKLLWVNPAVERITGYTIDECMAMPGFPVPIIAEADRETVARQMGAAVKGSSKNDFEFRVRHKDGHLAWVAASWQPIYDSRGVRLGHRSSIRDIAERKQAEDAVRRTQAYLTEAERLSRAGSWALDVASGKYLYASEEFFRIFGLDAQEGLPSREDFSRLIHPEDWDRANGSFEQQLREKRDITIEYRIALPNGTVKHVHAIRHPILNEAGDIVQLVGTVMDITDRKRAEEALRRSEAYLRETQKLAHAGSWVWDPIHRKFLYASDEMLRLYGFDPDQGIPTPDRVLERIHPDDRDRINHTRTGTADVDFDYRFVLPDGTLRHFHCIAHPVVGPSGEVHEVLGIAMDITDRKRAEEALRESEAYLAEAQRLSHTGSWAFDVASDKYVYASEECLRIFELNAHESLPTREGVSRLIHPEDWLRVNEAFETSLREKVDTVSEFRIVLPSGTGKHVQAIRHPVLNEAGEVVKLVGTVIDITERKRAEQERDRLRELEADLAHINRVSLLGELTASIAHEVNQPLAGVVSNAGASLRWLAGDPPNLERAREAVSRIVRDGKRAGEIIARIRALTRRAATPQEKLDPNQTIQDVLALVRDEATRNRVIIRTQFADGLVPVAGDRVQLQQVVLNLVLNGIEAMGSVSDRARELVLATRNLEPDQVQVTVEDAGTGLDPSALDKIFDPFYTTKPGGMGMGLSISRSIIEAHGGRLWATAKDGPGTMFHFTLPTYHEDESHA